MRMEDPVPTFKYITEQISLAHPNLMYLHFVESRDNSIFNYDQAPQEGELPALNNNEFARKIWAPRPFISAGGYSDAIGKAFKAAEERGVLIALGRAFVANVCISSFPSFLHASVRSELNVTVFGVPPARPATEAQEEDSPDAVQPRHILHPRLARRIHRPAFRSRNPDVIEASPDYRASILLPCCYL